MSTSLATTQSQASLSISETRLSVAQIKAQRDAIVELMKRTMKPGIDYGIVPGCDKPSLWKPGSEKILAMLHLAAEPRVEDLSTPDTLRYRVYITITHFLTGAVFGTGLGEASSAESKYQWRAAVCDEEWDGTPEDRRRIKWKKSKSGAYSIRQVRADMDDVANTVLKMGKKRAQIDAVLTCTAASDIFGQDLEELREAGIEDEPTPTPMPPAELQRKAPEPAPPPAQHQPPPQTTHATVGQYGAKTISEEQARRFWAKAMGRTNDYKAIMNYLREVHGGKRKEDILLARYDEAVRWAETGQA